jgi:hypothetical protein
LALCQGAGAEESQGGGGEVQGVQSYGDDEEGEKEMNKRAGKRNISSDSLKSVRMRRKKKKRRMRMTEANGIK